MSISLLKGLNLSKYEINFYAVIPAGALVQGMIALPYALGPLCVN